MLRMFYEQFGIWNSSILHNFQAIGVTFLLSSLRLITEGCIVFMFLLAGPSRAFGDLIAASGITDAMLESLIALKDLEGVEGLPL